MENEPSPEPSPENWPFSDIGKHPPWNSETAREAGRMGGRVRSERKAVANSLRRRVWCEPGCKIFFSCPFARMSRKEYENKCALKLQNANIQGFITSILLEENKLIEVICQLLAEMYIGSLGDFHNQAVLVEKLMRLYDLEHKWKEKTKNEGTFIVHIVEPEVLKKKPEDRPEILPDPSPNKA